MKIVFMGTPAAAAVSLEKLLAAGHEPAGVYTQPDRPSGRGNKIAFSPVKELALERGLRLFQPAKIRTPEAIAEFSSLRADVAVVVAYGRILPEGFLTAFPKGAVNLHFSLLPKYRGAAPVNWAIANGETMTGVTTIKMDAGLDTGDVLLARTTEIGPRETAPELMERLSVLGAEVLNKTLEDLDKLRPAPQDDSAASFAPIMKREDGIIDWEMDAGAISDRVRGFQPFPGSFTFLKGKKITIWSACPDEVHPPDPGASGTIISTSDHRLLVACGSGTLLRIDEVQMEGKRRMSVSDALNGSMFAVGDVFSVEGRGRPTCV
jgi:methionyl-tRNA formyltransferase